MNQESLPPTQRHWLKWTTSAEDHGSTTALLARSGSLVDVMVESASQPMYPSWSPLWPCAQADHRAQAEPFLRYWPCMTQAQTCAHPSTQQQTYPGSQQHQWPESSAAFQQDLRYPFRRAQRHRPVSEKPLWLLRSPCLASAPHRQSWRFSRQARCERFSARFENLPLF